MTETKKKTYADYAELPEGAPIQLINGEFVESPAPTVDHQSVIKVLFNGVYEMEKAGKGTAFFAPIDVYLRETENYQPDVIFIGNARAGIIGKKKIEGAPDIVMEILSPSTAYYDLRHKKKIYAEAGVREYWIADPIERSIEVYGNKDGEFELCGELVCRKEHRRKPAGIAAFADTSPAAGKIRSAVYPELSFDCVSVFGL